MVYRNPEVMLDFHVPSHRCPTCGVEHDGALNMSGSNPPANGDISVCAACGCINIFDDEVEGRMRLPNREEMAEIRANDMVLQASFAIRMSRG